MEEVGSEKERTTREILSFDDTCNTDGSRSQSILINCKRRGRHGPIERYREIKAKKR